MEENTITIVECRKLRGLISDVTNWCILTRDEYNQICDIVMGAMQRCSECEKDYIIAELEARNKP